MCVFVLAAECLKKLGRGTHPIFLRLKGYILCVNRLLIRIELGLESTYKTCP